MGDNPAKRSNGTARFPNYGPNVTTSFISTETSLAGPPGMLHELGGGGGGLYDVQTPAPFPDVNYPRGPDDDLYGPPGFNPVASFQYSNGNTKGPARRNGTMRGMKEGKSLLDTIKLPSETIKQTIGRNTNNMLDINITVSLDSMPYDGILGREQPIFLYLGSGSPVGDVHGSFLSALDKRPELRPMMIGNLPMVNYGLACQESYSNARPMTAREVLDMVRPHGAIVSDQGARQSDNAINGIEFALSIGGPRNVPNHWGSNIRAGTTCWYLLKRVPITRQFLLDPMGSNIDVPRPADGKELRPYAWMFIPWASHTQDTPHKDDVAYYNYDYDGGLKRHYGAAICVGFIEHRTLPPAQSDVDAALYSSQGAIMADSVAFYRLPTRTLFWE
jgi:hypothetical protein